MIAGLEGHTDNVYHFITIYLRFGLLFHVNFGKPIQLLMIPRVLLMALLLYPFSQRAQDNPDSQVALSLPERELFHQRERVREAVERGRDSSLIALERIRLGDLFLQVELYAEAMSEYQMANGYLGPAGPDSLARRLYQGIAKVHIGTEDYLSAGALLEEFLQSGKGGADGKERALTYSLLGICAEKQGDYLRALEYQGQGLELYRRLGDPGGASLVEEHLGSIYEDLGQYDLAQQHFERAYAFYKGKTQRETANMLNNLGDIFRKQGKLDLAGFYTGKALELARELGDNHQMESAHKDLAKTLAASGHFREAYENLQQADAYKSAVLEAHNNTQKNVLQTVYETDKKESEIRLLREQNRVNSANQRLLGVSVAALLILLSGVVVLGSRKRKMELKFQALQQKALRTELEQKALEETNLQKEINLKSAALTRYSLNLSHKNKLLTDLSKSLSQMASRKHMDLSGKIRSLVQEIDQSLNQEMEWDEFMHIFEEIHPDFARNLSGMAREPLTPAELRLGMLLRMNLSSKEIASLLRVTPDSVRVARHRLRKKLPIETKKELVNFLVKL